MVKAAAKKSSLDEIAHLGYITEKEAALLDVLRMHADDAKAPKGVAKTIYAAKGGKPKETLKQVSPKAQKALKAAGGSGKKTSSGVKSFSYEDSHPGAGYQGNPQSQGQGNSSGASGSSGGFNGGGGGNTNTNYNDGLSKNGVAPPAPPKPPAPKPRGFIGPPITPKRVVPGVTQVPLKPQVAVPAKPAALVPSGPDEFRAPPKPAITSPDQIAQTYPNAPKPSYGPDYSPDGLDPRSGSSYPSRGTMPTTGNTGEYPSRGATSENSNPGGGSLHQTPDTGNEKSGESYHVSGTDPSRSFSPPDRTGSTNSMQEADQRLSQGPNTNITKGKDVNIPSYGPDDNYNSPRELSGNIPGRNPELQDRGNGPLGFNPPLKDGQQKDSSQLPPSSPLSDRAIRNDPLNTPSELNGLKPSGTPPAATPPAPGIVQQAWDRITNLITGPDVSGGINPNKIPNRNMPNGLGIPNGPTNLRDIYTPPAGTYPNAPVSPLSKLGTVQTPERTWPQAINDAWHAIIDPLRPDQMLQREPDPPTSKIITDRLYPEIPVPGQPVPNDPIQAAHGSYIKNNPPPAPPPKEIQDRIPAELMTPAQRFAAGDINALQYPKGAADRFSTNNLVYGGNSPPTQKTNQTGYPSAITSSNGLAAPGQRALGLDRLGSASPQSELQDVVISPQAGNPNAADPRDTGANTPDLFGIAGTDTVNGVDQQAVAEAVKNGLFNGVNGNFSPDNMGTNTSTSGVDPNQRGNTSGSISGFNESSGGANNLSVPQELIPGTSVPKPPAPPPGEKPPGGPDGVDEPFPGIMPWDIDAYLQLKQLYTTLGEKDYTPGQFVIQFYQQGPELTPPPVPYKRESKPVPPSQSGAAA